MKNRKVRHTSEPLGLQVKRLKQEMGESFAGFYCQKELTIKSFKGAEITDDQMTVINSYALEPLIPDQVYVRKFLLAHNAIDRDRERFPDDMLDDFAETLSGKSFLFGHARPNPGIGLFFDAVTEKMTPEEFKKLTGVELSMPENIDTVNVLWTWAYMMKIPANEEIMANIDGGIYRHVSIGFRAADIAAVKKDVNGPVLYWEYVAPGEALEGSLVWLGAQQGATAQKTVLLTGDVLAEIKADNLHKSENQNEGGKIMNELLKRLSKLCGKVLTEDDVVDGIKDMITEKDTDIQRLTDQISSSADEKDATIKGLEEKVEELSPLAEEGKVYRKSLVDSYITLKTKLEEIPADNQTKQDEATKVAKGFPVEFLKAEIGALQKRVDEKFPDGPELDEEDPDKKKGEKKKGRLVPQEEKDSK